MPKREGTRFTWISSWLRWECRECPNFPTRETLKSHCVIMFSFKNTFFFTFSHYNYFEILFLFFSSSFSHSSREQSEIEEVWRHFYYVFSPSPLSQIFCIHIATGFWPLIFSLHFITRMPMSQTSQDDFSWVLPLLREVWRLLLSASSQLLNLCLQILLSPFCESCLMLWWLKRFHEKIFRVAVASSRRVNIATVHDWGVWEKNSDERQSSIFLSLEQYYFTL